MKTFSVSDAIEQYPPRMKRSQVVELGGRLGLSEWTMRRMLEVRPAPIRGIVYPGRRYQYFDRDTVIQTLFQSAVSAMPS